MPLTGIIKTLFKDKNKTQPIFPRTVFNAVMGYNGETWQEELDAKADETDLQPLANEEELGINIWDEEWENGAYNRTTGEKSNSSSEIRCARFIPVIPNKKYYIKVPADTLCILQYGKNKNYLSTSSFVGNNEITLRSDTYYITFYTGDGYPTTEYGNDICINLSNPLYNGTYYASVGIRRDISKEPIYEIGETYSILTAEHFCGIVSSSSSSVLFTLQLPKKVSGSWIIENISRVYIRWAGGGYIRFYNGENITTINNYSGEGLRFSITSVNENNITITITNSSSATDKKFINPTENATIINNSLIEVSVIATLRKTN